MLAERAEVKEIRNQQMAKKNDGQKLWGEIRSNLFSIYIALDIKYKFGLSPQYTTSMP